MTEPTSVGLSRDGVRNFDLPNTCFSETCKTTSDEMGHERDLWLVRFGAA